MAWISPAESDVLTVLSETELATYRAAALAAGQADPLAPTLAQVVDLVRGYVGAFRPNTLGPAGTIPQKLLATALDLVAVRLPQRVGVAPKVVRQAAAAQALRLLERVAAGEFTIEEPDTVSTETPAAPTPTIAARPRRFSWREEEGT
ncbi:MAG: hypothetical protein WDO13_09575 [Verrucomicrobiota bacterium]